MTRRVLYIIILLVGFSSTSGTTAAERPVEWGLLFGAGGAQSFLNPSEQPWAVGYELRLGWDLRLNSNWRLSVTAGRRKFFDDTTTTEVFKFPDPKSKSWRTWTGTVFNLNVRRLLLSKTGLRPYVLGGFGLTSWQIKDYSTETLIRVPDPDGREKDFEAKEWHFNLGVGAEYDLSSRLSARAGLDFFYLTGWGTSFAREVDDYRTRGNLVLSVGLTAYLGSRKVRQPAQTEQGDVIITQLLEEIQPPDTTSVTTTGEGELPPEESSTKAVPRRPSKDDEDGDGVPDSTDLCPETTAGLAVDDFGCPRDSDGDGVIDRDDVCAGTPRGAFVDSVGCPTDSDGDGVFDGLDFCPATVTRWRELVDEHGCVSDADGDGVPDARDSCPQSAEGAQVDSTGCVPDTDSDGVPDLVDRCPGTPSGLAVDEHGCLVMTQLNRKLLLFPDFEAGLTAIDRISRRILNDLAVRLAAAPAVKVFIRAFTDNIGGVEANQLISQKRADRARQYLIKRGIVAERIMAIGLGEIDFIAANSTAAGRKRNRRLEITYEH